MEDDKIFTRAYVACLNLNYFTEVLIGFVGANYVWAHTTLRRRRATDDVSLRGHTSAISGGGPTSVHKQRPRHSGANQRNIEQPI